MFKDERFVSKCTIDKRGRPNTFTSKENFRKYYDLESSGSSCSDDDDEDDNEDDNELNDDQVSKSSDQSDADLSETNDRSFKSKPEHIKPEIKKKLLNSNVDYARGEGVLMSDSSSGEESDELDDEQE